MRESAGVARRYHACLMHTITAGARRQSLHAAALDVLAACEEGRDRAATLAACSRHIA